MQHKTDPIGLLFYKFYFKGIKEPVMVVARNKDEARGIMRQLLLQPVFRLHRMTEIIGETVTAPVYGVSERWADGNLYIWVGSKTSTGWMEKSEFDKLPLPE